MAEELTVFVVPLTSLDDPELASASGLVSTALEELVPGDQYAQEFSEDLQLGRDQLHAAGVKDLTNPETANKNAADSSRDSKYLGFRTRTESLVYSDDMTIVADASKILDRIYQRGYGMQNFGLKKQTSAMDGLILDLKEPPFPEAMTRIGINKEFDAMVQSENAFKQSEDNHARAATSITNVSLVETRKFVRTCIEECNFWLANRFRKEPQKVKAMVVRWNETFTTITAEARSRDTRKSNQAAASKNSKPAATAVSQA